MSFHARSLSPQIAVRPLIALSLAVAGLVVLLPPLPAQAFENKAFGDVTVEQGEVEEEVSTTFGDVRVDGLVEEDVHSGFGDVLVSGGGVGDDINAGYGDVEVHAPVGGGIEAGFGNVYINAPVGGDVDVGRGDVRLGPEARVAGDIACGSGQVRPHPGALVDGNVKMGMTPDIDYPSAGILDLVGWLFAAAVFVACSVLAAVLAPGPLLAAARRAEESPGWSLLLGVASVPAVVVLSVVLAISLVGIPLLLLLAPAYLALLFFGALVAAYFVGRKVVLATGRYRAGNVLAAMVGSVIVAGAYLIPVLGNLIFYALTLLGTGAAVLALFSRRRPRPTYSSYEAYVQDRRDA